MTHLQIIKDVSEEYDKVCQALAMMLESFPRVEIYADVFAGSSLVQEAVHDLFISTLNFWIKACKFYRRRFLWNFMRGTWNDYDSEFSRLENAMTGALNRIEKVALAEHIKDSKAFMTEQRLKSVENARTQETDDNQSIFATLAPSNEDMNYYIRDHENFSQLRHANTCEWILKHPKFLAWSQTPLGKSAHLWISAGPGVGKTILSSFIINHLQGAQAQYQHPVLLYFYFRDSAYYSNNASAAMLSIMFQLHKQHKDKRHSIETNVKSTYGSASDNRKSSFPDIWNRLSCFLDSPSNVFLILDGLDECQDSNLLVPRLLKLFHDSKMKVLITSRREKHLVKYLDHLETLQIRPEDLHHDIRKFAEHKIGRSPRLSHPAVCDTILKSVLSRHDGMFLWVYLMFKELKACISVEEVQMTLLQIPGGLEATYISIVQRLQKSLTRRAAETTRKILTWVLGSARSLSMDELREALCSQYQLEGQILLSNGEFPYAEKDIELMCGSLISIRDGQIRTVHQSTKGYLIGMSSDQRFSMDMALLPNSIETSLQITSVCLTYLKKYCTSSIRRLQNVSSDNQLGKKIIHDLRNENKLIEYTCFFWVHHVLDCPTNNRENVLALIASHFSNFVTISWIVTSLLLDSRGLWRLFIGVEEMQDWLTDGKVENEQSDSERCVEEWCLGLLKVFKNYGTLLLESPWIIWRLDLTAFIGAEQPLIELSDYLKVSRESEYVFQGSMTSACRLQEIPANEKLDHNQWSLLKARLGFFVYDKNQKVFISGEQSTTNGEECLFVQNAESGRRLTPAIAGLVEIGAEHSTRHGYVITAKISREGRYFAVAYNSWVSIWVIEPNLEFSYRLRDRGWAFRLLTHQYDQPLETNSSEMIAFGEDEKLFVPEGWYNLPSKEFHPFNWVEITDQPNPVIAISFSGDGSHVFTEHQKHSSKFVVRQSTSKFLRNPIARTFDVDSEWRIRPSNTGKYILQFEAPTWSYKKSSFNTKLVDFGSGDTFNIPQELASFGERSFHFSHTDARLVTFLMGPGTRNGRHALLTVTVWELGKGDPKVCSQGQILVSVAAHPATVINPPIITVTAQNIAWILPCDRTIRIVKFDSEGISFSGPVSSTDEKTVMQSQISRDGHHLGMLQMLNSEVHFEIIDLLPSRNEDVLFSKRFPLPAGTTQPICLSPNLDLFILGSFAFTGDLKHFDQSPIELDIDLKCPERDWNWVCSISACGNFLAYDKPAYKHSLNSYNPQPGRSILFKIDRTKRTMSRLNTPSPENLQLSSLEFHPSLPLAARSYLQGEGKDYNGFQNPSVPANAIPLAMVHLDNNTMIPLENLQIERQISWELRIADSGDFIFLGENQFRYQRMQGRLIVSNIPCPPTPLRIITKDRIVHPSKDRCYMLTAQPTSVAVTMYRFQTDAVDAGTLPVYQTVESSSKVEQITAWPSTRGWPDAWLLLGEDYSAPMKLLLGPNNQGPPVIKTLVMTWDELRDQLETTLKPVEQSAEQS